MSKHPKYRKNPIINAVILPFSLFSIRNTWAVIIFCSYTIWRWSPLRTHFLPCRVDDVCPKEIWPDVEAGVTAAPHGAVPQFSFRLHALSSLSSFAISSHLQNLVPRPSWKLVVFRILYTLSPMAHPRPSPLFSFFKKHFLLVPPPRRTSAGHIQLLRCCSYLEAQFIFEQLSQSPKQK